jgi:hypothetical protein
MALDGETLDELENLIGSAEGEMTYTTQLAYNLLKAGSRNHFFHVHLPGEAPELRKVTNQNPGLLHQQKQSSVTVYPSPADAYVTIDYQLPEGTTNAVLSVFNVQGQQLHTIPLSAAQGQGLLDIRQLPAGLYVVEVKADGQFMKRGKMVINR